MSDDDRSAGERWAERGLKSGTGHVVGGMAKSAFAAKCAATGAKVGCAAGIAGAAAGLAFGFLVGKLLEIEDAPDKE